MSESITRRQVIQAGSATVAATFAGYAVGVDKVLAQAIKTDTTGIAAGDFEVKIGDYGMPVYEARPASGPAAPIVVVHLRDLGRARVGPRRHAPLRQGRLLRGRARAVQARGRRRPHPERAGHR